MIVGHLWLFMSCAAVSPIFTTIAHRSLASCGCVATVKKLLIIWMSLLKTNWGESTWTLVVKNPEPAAALRVKIDRLLVMCMV